MANDAHGLGRVDMSAYVGERRVDRFTYVVHITILTMPKNKESSDPDLEDRVLTIEIFESVRYVSGTDETQLRPISRDKLIANTMYLVEQEDILIDGELIKIIIDCVEVYVLHKEAGGSRLIRVVDHVFK